MEEAAEERGPGCPLRGLITFRQEGVGGADAGLTGSDPYDERVTLGTLSGGRDRATSLGGIETPEAKNSAVFPGFSFPIFKRRDYSTGLSSPRCCGAPHTFLL